MATRRRSCCTPGRVHVGQEGTGRRADSCGLQREAVLYRDGSCGAGWLEASVVGDCARENGEVGVGPCVLYGLRQEMGAAYSGRRYYGIPSTGERLAQRIHVGTGGQSHPTQYNVGTPRTLLLLVRTGAGDGAGWPSGARRTAGADLGYGISMKRPRIEGKTCAQCSPVRTAFCVRAGSGRVRGCAHTRHHLDPSPLVRTAIRCARCCPG